MIQEIVRQKMYEAMKNKDKEKKEFYAFLLDRLMKTAKAKQTPDNPNPELTENEELAVIQGIVKQIRNAIDEVEGRLPNMTNETSIADANEFIAAQKAELAMYEEFLPKQMTEDEIREVIKETMAENGIATLDNKSRGVLMKHLMSKVRGRADGKLVAKTVDSMVAR